MRRLRMAMGHVILREFHLDRQAEYFEDYTPQYTDMPDAGEAGREGRRLVRAASCAPRSGRDWAKNNNPDWKTVAIDEMSKGRRAERARSVIRWGEQGEWNLERRTARQRHEAEAERSFRMTIMTTSAVDFPISAARHEHFDGTRPP